MKLSKILLLLTILSTHTLYAFDPYTTGGTEHYIRKQRVEYFYEVRVNGKHVPIHTENFVVPILWARFTVSGQVRIEIKSQGLIAEYSVRPKRSNITYNLSDDQHSLRFNLDEPGYMSVKINDYLDLFLFAEPEEKKPPKADDVNVRNVLDYNADPTGASLSTAAIQKAIDEATTEKEKSVVFVPAGLFNCATLYLKSNVTLYLAPGANLRSIKTESAPSWRQGFIHVEDADNVSILGRGIIDGARGQLDTGKDKPQVKRIIWVENANHIRIEGVIIKDPMKWTTRFERVSDLVIRNVKVMSNRPVQAHLCTDGINIMGGNNCLVENCFIYTGDDCMCVKGAAGKQFSKDPADASSNVTFRNIVCYTNRRACEIGIESRSAYIRDVTFENIDILHCGMALVIDDYDWAQVSNIKYSNICIEDWYIRDDEHNLIQFIAPEAGYSWYTWGTGGGNISNVLIENVIAAKPMRSTFYGGSENHTVSDICIRNLIINGKKITNTEEGKFEINPYVKNITFED